MSVTRLQIYSMAHIFDNLTPNSLMLLFSSFVKLNNMTDCMYMKLKINVLI